MPKVLLYFTIGLVLTSCKSRIERTIQGTWVIDQAYYHHEPVLWNLYGNGLLLNKDNSCRLPIVKPSDRYTTKKTGTWKAYKQDQTFLEINTSNETFNRKFVVLNLRKVRDSVSWGYFMKMTLTADSLTLDCTKALYE